MRLGPEKPDAEPNEAGGHMSLEEFNQGLRSLISLDFDELVADGAFAEWQSDAWQDFRRDPFRTFLHADEETVDIIWDMVQARQPQRQMQAA